MKCINRGGIGGLGNKKRNDIGKSLWMKLGVENGGVEMCWIIGWGIERYVLLWGDFLKYLMLFEGLIIEN